MAGRIANIGDHQGLLPKARTATGMDGTLHTDFRKSETSRDIKKTTWFTQYLSYLNPKGEDSSCNIDRSISTYISKLKWAWQA
jgi:hypothetical protein